MKTRILVLDSLSGIWPHSLQILKVAKQFDRTKVDVHYVSCGKAAPNFCTVQESRGQIFIKDSAPKASTCRDCVFTAKLNEMSLHGVFHRQNLNETFLSSLIDENILAAEQKFMNEVDGDIENNLDLEVCGTPVVRHSLYETILKFKKKDLSFSDSELDYFKSILSNSVRFSLIGSKFFSTNNNYAACLAYAPQYAINNSFLHQAYLAGIKVYFVDGNGNIAERYSAVVVWNWNRYKLERPALIHWRDEDLNKHIPTSNQKRIGMHKKQLANARSFSVYSEPSKGHLDVRQKYKIGGHEKIWLLALSSLDEAYAAQLMGAYPQSKYPGAVFNNQYEWVMSTIEWVAKQKNLTLIIRMHPRDLPNKRESVTSEQAGVWEKILENLPVNVRLNHPSDQVPIGDLLRISDGFLTGWSTSALEAMDYGIPVVTYDYMMPSYPRNIHLSGNSKELYFKNLSKLLRLQKSDANRLTADKWLDFMLNKGSVKLTGRLLEPLRIRGPRWISRGFNALDIFFPYIYRPLELLVTVRKTKEGKRIEDLVLAGKDSLYEV